jgi:hypothetical protein
MLNSFAFLECTYLVYPVGSSLTQITMLFHHIISYVQDGLASNVENDGTIISIPTYPRLPGPRPKIVSSSNSKRMAVAIVGLILPNVYQVVRTMLSKIIGIPV